MINKEELYVKNLYLPHINYLYEESILEVNSMQNIGIYTSKEKAKKVLESYTKATKEKADILEEQEDFYLVKDYFESFINEIEINKIIKKEIFVLNFYTEVTSLSGGFTTSHLVLKPTYYIFYDFEEAKSFIDKAISLELYNVDNSDKSIESFDINDTEDYSVDINYYIEKIELNTHYVIPIYKGCYEILYNDMNNKNESQQRQSYLENENEDFLLHHYNSIISLQEKNNILNSLKE